MKPKSNVVFSLKYIKSEVLNYATLRGGFDRIDENRKKIGVQRIEVKEDGLLFVYVNQVMPKNYIIKIYFDKIG